MKTRDDLARAARNKKIYRGVSHYRPENFKRATEDLTKAARTHSDFVEVFKYRGMAYEFLGEEEKATADFLTAAVLDENS